MGLDGFEFTMRLRKEFGIDLLEDATKLQTVGQVHEYLRSRLPRGLDEPGHLKHIFYRLRDAMAAELEIPRRLIRPSARIDSLFNVHRLRRQHRSLQNSVGFEVPPILRRRQDGQTSWGALVFIGLLAIVPFFFLEGLVLGMMALAVAIGISLAVGYLDDLTSPNHPWRVVTSDRIAELVERTIIVNKPAMGTWTELRIWLTLKHIVAEQANVFPDEITRDTQFERDLCLG